MEKIEKSKKIIISSFKNIKGLVTVLKKLIELPKKLLIPSLATLGFYFATLLEIKKNIDIPFSPLALLALISLSCSIIVGLIIHVKYYMSEIIANINKFLRNLGKNAIEMIESDLVEKDFSGKSKEDAINEIKETLLKKVIKKRPLKNLYAYVVIQVMAYLIGLISMIVHLILYLFICKF